MGHVPPELTQLGMGGASAPADGAPRRGLTEEMKRNILIGLALLVIATMVVIMATGGGKTPPEKSKSKPEAAVTPELPDKVTEIIPTKGDFQASTPPPQPVPKPEPKPEPKPSPETVKPTAAFAKIHELRVTYRDQWNSLVEEKLTESFGRLSGQYAQALQRLEDEYLSNGDAANVLVVRGEAERFEKSHEAVKPDAVSSNKRIATLQLALNSQLGKLREGLKYDSDSVKEKYMLALRELERKMDDADDKTGSQAVAAEFAKVAPLVDADLKSYFNAEATE